MGQPELCRERLKGHAPGYFRKAGRLVCTMTALVMLAGLLMPAPASAQIFSYIWKPVNDGVWKNRTNWNCVNPVDGSACVGDTVGFPSRNSDVANFIADYSNTQSVRVDGTVRVGRIIFGTTAFSIFLNPANSQSQFVMNSGTTDPATIETEGDGGAAFRVRRSSTRRSSMRVR